MCWCIGSMLGSCMCSMCSSAFKGAGAISHQIPYLVLMTIAALFAFFMREFGTKDLFEDFQYYDAQLCNTDACLFNGTAFRVSLTLVIFHAAHFVFLLIPMVPYSFHSGCFMVKVLGYAALLTWSFWWDNDSFDQYADACRVMSFFFLLYQTCIILFASVEIDTTMFQIMEMDKMEQETSSKGVGFCYAFIIFALFGVAATLQGLFYSWYGGGNCHTNNFLITISLVVTVCMFILSHPSLTDSSFFSGAAIAMYACWLLYAALSTDEDPSCNTFLDEGETTADKTPASVWLGLIILIVSMSYIPPCYKEAQHTRENLTEVEKNEEELGEEHQNQNVKNLLSAERKVALQFHVVMILASMYLAMVITNWGYLTESDTKKDGNVWVNIVAEWVCLGMYGYFLAAGAFEWRAKYREIGDDANVQEEDVSDAVELGEEDDSKKKQEV